MPTQRQETGLFGETVVVRQCSCPRCKRKRSLVRLPPNFKCADIICDFCGYLAQVKTSVVTDVSTIPARILGAAWEPQKERMAASIYFPLFLVLRSKFDGAFSIFFLSADLQQPSMFVPRPPLSASARRAGWQGFVYDLREVGRSFVRLA